jgi:hypothetical protein
MEKEILTQSIFIGYQDGIEDLENEDNVDYEPNVIELPLESTETQYAYEFGLMMAREGFEILTDDIDGYLEEILDDANSNLGIGDLT